MDQIGEYLVRRLIGEGGMGKVYEGEERLSRRRVALKVLHQELARSEQGRRLFLNEMQILAHLEHANIVRSLASIEVGGELVMVLEYLDGRTLRSWLNAEGRLPWVEAVRVASSVAAGLAAAHGQEPAVIHRDLKPENIMVLQDGSVKVMDFGIAKVIEAINQTNTQSVGTLQYMSPEQIDARTIDHRSDLYCLGLVLYEMLCGRPPFQSASPRQLLNLQCTAEPPPLEDEVRVGLPRGVEQLLFQLLEKAPEDRPYLAEDVVGRLEPFHAAAPATRGSGSGRATSAAITPHRSGGAGERGSAGSGPGAERAGATAPAVSAERSAAAERSAGREPGGAREAERGGGEEGSGQAIGPGAGAARRAPAPRVDTIALLDQVDRRREVPTAVAVGIIVALSALAGIGAYVVRSTSAPAEPATSATAAVVAPPARTR